MAILINEDGTEKQLGRKPGLKQLQGAVGGLIELVVCPDGREMYVNEEGLFRKDFGINVRASEMASRPLVGPAVLLEDGDED